MKLATFSLLAGSTAAFPALLDLSGNGPLLDLSGKGGLIDLGGDDGGLLGLTGKGGLLDLSGLSDLSVADFNEQRAKNNTWPAADPALCPFNPNHKDAVAWNPKFPYSGAKGGLPGTGKGGYLVPAPGDEDHKFIQPGPNDIRGPCPGMNMLANHGFIARDGITNFVEAVDACQNVFNMEWDLAVVITLLATVLGDGDAITQKFSIGCDATSRTAAVDLKLLSGSQPGLNGHGNFEVDGSISRDDYFISEGDVFTLNSTLFAQMVETTEGKFTKSGISKLKHLRWQQSQRENPNFFYGPIGLISYAASAFLPELFGDGESASTETIATFFGVGQGADGTWTYGHNETIPAEWYARETPYGLSGVVKNLLAMYLENPVLFGGNTADGHFDGIDFGAIKEGKLDVGISVDDTLCLIYQLLAWPIPGPANGVLDIGKDAVALITSLLGKTISDLGCPAPLNAS